MAVLHPLRDGIQTLRKEKKMTEQIHEFYAVTKTSVYHVKDERDEHGCPIIEKIALRGESRVGVGERLRGGYRVAVTKIGIFPYVPDPHDGDAPESVNTICWGDRSSPLTGLFLRKEDAMACFGSENLVAYDKRWQRETEKVMNAIGGKHPVFTVSHFFDRPQF